MGNQITIENNTNGPISGFVSSPGIFIFNIPINESKNVTVNSSNVSISLNGQSCPEGHMSFTGVTPGSIIVVSGDLSNCPTIRFKLIKGIIPGVIPVAAVGISLTSAPVKVSTGRC